MLGVHSSSMPLSPAQVMLLDEMKVTVPCQVALPKP
jgi:hypothetical protein